MGDSNKGGHLVNGAQGVLPKSAHGSKPLFGGTENRGFLGAPVVGVFVGIGLLLEQGAAFGQSSDDGGVAFTQDIQPNKPDMTWHVTGGEVIGR